MLNLYAKLQESPLFTGLTSDNIAQIIGQTKFSFSKFQPKEIIKREGELCRNLTFLISGHAKMVSFADDYGYSVEEDVSAPLILQPERLFGLTQRYTKTFCAESECDTMSIDKNDMMRLIDDFFVVRINLLNIISTISQKNARLAWRHTSDDDMQRITRFFKQHVCLPYGRKTIRIKMTRLALETNQSRLAVSKELNRLKEDGLLTFSRGIIEIPAFERIGKEQIS